MTLPPSSQNDFFYYLPSEGEAVYLHSEQEGHVYQTAPVESQDHPPPPTWMSGYYEQSLESMWDDYQRLQTFENQDLQGDVVDDRAINFDSGGGSEDYCYLELNSCGNDGYGYIPPLYFPSSDSSSPTYSEESLDDQTLVQEPYDEHMHMHMTHVQPEESYPIVPPEIFQFIEKGLQKPSFWLHQADTPAYDAVAECEYYNDAVAIDVADYAYNLQYFGSLDDPQEQFLLSPIEIKQEESQVSPEHFAVASA